MFLLFLRDLFSLCNSYVFIIESKDMHKCHFCSATYLILLLLAVSIFPPIYYLCSRLILICLFISFFFIFFCFLYLPIIVVYFCIVLLIYHMLFYLFLIFWLANVIFHWIFFSLKIRNILKGILRLIFCIDINTHSDKEWKTV